MQDEPVYRGILGIDIERFSRAEWTDPTRARLRDRLHTLVDHALASADIPPPLTIRSDTGDGLWLLGGAQVSTARLLHPLASSLASGLADDNQHAPAAERMRLRVVVHAGELLQDLHGHTGQSWNHAARLLNAEATRAVLAANPAATVVLVVCDVLYDGVVRHAYEGIDPDGWQPTRVHGREMSARAWVHLPGLATQPKLPAVLAVPRVGQAGLSIPRELPRPPGDFTGRAGELASLWELLGVDPSGAVVSRSAGSSGQPGRPVVITAIDGMGGIGKSALAIQAAHELADADVFPDGQLYVNLQGATPGLAPLAPLEALGRMLRSLGVDPATVPGEVEEAAARFRSLAAQRRLLLVLDNAHDPEQVGPLLPASPTCAVLVTSRQVLATLEGADRVHLDVLPEGLALELLGRVAGASRVAAEPRAAVEVVGSCAHLPLAIRIAGARLAARPAWRVRALADCLADATARLEELQAGGLAVRASFDVSLHALHESPDPLDRAAVAAFGLLSLPDGPDLSLAAAARLLDQPERATQRLLERLIDAQLLEAPRPGRYQFHDLVRLHARRHATRQQPQPERLAALTRLVGFYTATTWHIWTLMDPGNSRAAVADPRWIRGGFQFADDRAALAWLEAERVNLLAAIAQAAQAAPATPGIPVELPGQLTRALATLFETHGYWQDGVQANQTALELARRAGDRTGQAHALNDLGFVYTRQGRYEEALTCLRGSLTLYRELGDCGGQAVSLTRLSGVHRRVGHYREAIACLQESLTLSRELHNRWHQADTLHDLGVVYGQVGRFEEAITSLQESRSIFQELGHRLGQADSLQGLGVAYGRVGRFVEAIAYLRDGLTLRRELGDRAGQAEALRDLGDALNTAAQHQQAQATWQQALTICEALQLPEADEVRARLASLQPETAEPAGSENVISSN